MNYEQEWNQLSHTERREIANMLTARWWLWRLGIIAIVLTLFGMIVLPVYGVWQQGLTGEAELARAAQNRQIEIERAAAVKAASADLAAAEVIRAQGVKDSNDIIAEGLGGPEGYLRYLFINGLNSPDSTCEAIYVPTEANLPILETVRPLADG